MKSDIPLDKFPKRYVLLLNGKLLDGADTLEELLEIATKSCTREILQDIADQVLKITCSIFKLYHTDYRNESMAFAQVCPYYTGIDFFVFDTKPHVAEFDTLDFTNAFQEKNKHHAANNSVFL